MIGTTEFQFMRQCLKIFVVSFLLSPPLFDSFFIALFSQTRSIQGSVSLSIDIRVKLAEKCFEHNFALLL